jgi:hypothetical protein
LIREFKILNVADNSWEYAIEKPPQYGFGRMFVMTEIMRKIFKPGIEAFGIGIELTLTFTSKTAYVCSSTR